MVDITRSELQSLLDLQLKKYIEQIAPAIDNSVNSAIRRIGIMPIEWVSQAKAYRQYGRTTVRRWVMQGWLPVYSDGNNKRKRIMRNDLERCAARNNRQKDG